jgi:hypothetical protein
MIVDRSDVSEYSPNVLGQRAGQATEWITANRSARNTTAWRNDFFSTLSQIRSSFIPPGSAMRAEHVHTNGASSALLAGMLPPSEGDGGTPSSVLPGFDSPGKTSEPIGSLRSLANYQLATPSIRNVRPQDWEEWQKATECPASPKRRKADQANIIRISEDGLVQLVENTMTSISRDFVALKPTISSRDFVALKPTISSIEESQALRGEVEANISKVRIELTQLVNTTMKRMQAEAERRAESMLQKLTQMLRLAPRNHVDRVAPVIDTEVASGRSTRGSGSQGQNQTTRARQPSWATFAALGRRKRQGGPRSLTVRRERRNTHWTKGVLCSSETWSPTLVILATLCTKSTKLLQTLELT